MWPYLSISMGRCYRHHEALGWLRGGVCVQQRLSFLLIPVLNLRSESLFACHSVNKKNTILFFQKGVIILQRAVKYIERRDPQAGIRKGGMPGKGFPMSERPGTI